jgi:hypothetical protein
MDDLELDCYLGELDLKRYAPRAPRGPSEVQPWSERACTLLALTQVWQKIRAEYYPLWLRNLSVALDDPRASPLYGDSPAKVYRSCTCTEASADLLGPQFQRF